MPESTKSPAEVLEGAAELLEQPGAWMQDDYCLGDATAKGLRKADCWCIAGAIGAVLGVSGPEAEQWANTHLAPLIPGLITNHPVALVPGWNDAPERTQAEVVAALRQASRRGGEA